MKKKKPLSDEEVSLFQQAVKDVRPLKRHNKITQTFREKKTPHHFQEKQCQHDHYRVSDSLAPDAFCRPDEELNFKVAGVQNIQLKKLRQGKIPFEARIDLHGLTIHQARSNLDQFIHHSMRSGFRCVIVIHGKGTHTGKPILKSMINHWLTQISDVLAFTSAQKKHGGQGAVYVLLKKSH